VAKTPRMIHVEDETWELIRDASKDEEVSISEWVRRAINARLAKLARI